MVGPFVLILALGAACSNDIPENVGAQKDSDSVGSPEGDTAIYLRAVAVGERLGVNSEAKSGTEREVILNPDKESEAQEGEDTESPVDSSEVGERNPSGAFVDRPEEYADEEPPDDSVTTVLCNLNSEYVGSLAEYGLADNEANIDLAALSLNDHIQVWETLVGFYPETGGDVDLARQILNDWYAAMELDAAGQSAEAKSAYEDSIHKIDSLPRQSAAVDELGC